MNEEGLSADERALIALVRRMIRPARGAGDTPGADVVALSPRVREVLGLVARGATNREIAAELGIRPQTVKNYLTELMRSLGAQSRTALACLYYGDEPYVPTVRAHGDRYAHRR